MSHYLDAAAKLDPKRAADLAANDALLEVNPCTRCEVCGGTAKPGENGLCQACRNLALVWGRE